MYVIPEVWLLPLRWREKTAQFSPPPPDPGEDPGEEPGEYGRRIDRGGKAFTTTGLGFASSARLKTKVGAAAATARGVVAATAAAAAAAATAADVAAGRHSGGTAGFEAGDGGRRREGGKHRRASLPAGAVVIAGGGGAASALVVDPLSCRELHRGAGAGAVWETGAAELGTRVEGKGDSDGGEVMESVTEMEVRGAGAALPTSSKT